MLGVVLLSKISKNLIKFKFIKVEIIDRETFSEDHSIWSVELFEMFETICCRK